MKRAACIALVLVVGSGAAALAVEACGFPDVDFAPEDASANESGSGPLDGSSIDGSGDGAQVLDGGREAQVDVDPEGGLQEAGTAGDAAQVDASGCQTCDCDKDGFNRIDLSAGCDGGPNGKLPDCDDLNGAIHPGLGFIGDPWPPGTKYTPVGDWDCDGVTTRQFAYDGTCASLSNCSDGFVGSPPCGGTSDYLTCQQALVPVLGLTCSEKTREVPGKKTQGCH